MRILSLDLDFFLNYPVTGRADDINSRPDNHGLVPWSSDEVVRYLEETLNLKAPVPGKVVTSHHEVFYQWRDLIEREKLTSPFFVCHVDAHADLGVGGSSWVYLHSDFLELPLSERRNPMEGDTGLNFGSFMSFAIGNRWINQVDFVAPTFWRDDISQFQLTEEHLARQGEFIKPGVELHIELMHIPRRQFDPISPAKDILKSRRSIGEPKIPFNIVPQNSVAHRYERVKWDYVFLSHSPGYVPTTADALLPIISAYINDLYPSVESGGARKPLHRSLLR